MLSKSSRSICVVLLVLLMMLLSVFIIGGQSAIAAEVEDIGSSDDSYIMPLALSPSTWAVCASTDFFREDVNYYVPLISKGFVFPYSDSTSVYSYNFAYSSNTLYAPSSFDLIYIPQFSSNLVFVSVTLSGTIMPLLELRSTSSASSSRLAVANCTSVSLYGLDTSGNELLIDVFKVSAGYVNLSGTYPLPGDIVSFAFRVNFEFLKVNGSIPVGASIRFVFPSSDVTLTTVNRSSDLYHQIYQETLLVQIRDYLASIEIPGIYQAPPAQQSASEQYIKDMDKVSQEIEDANKIIEDNTNRPSAESLRPPDITTIVDPSNPGYAAAMEGMGNFLATDFIVNILLLMCTIAFCGYVLFGKKG